MARMTKDASHTQRKRGFKRAANLMGDRIKAVSQQRGFAVSRLLTHWEEIAGPEIAAISRPVEVSYGKGGFGATLCLLTTGANAPVLEMQKTGLRARVNAAYGYNAISGIRITQTHASGFSEGQVDFAHRKIKAGPEETDPEVLRKARACAVAVGDTNLRQALEALGQNILTKHKRLK
ncbi:DUF721 domain-containing protein [uncultured Lentibacter sp.]|jgi:hypothetical protein|uniref:DUF721 domain-containing protein n=1 Tax=uncultured Lentibacter sp. TaxID=1659309 RepID=UPI00261E8F3D|nr:DciA family protein [uncultured Lentibacter sp.]